MRADTGGHLTCRWSRTLDRGFPFATASLGRPQAPLNSALDALSDNEIRLRKEGLGETV